MCDFLSLLLFSLWPVEIRHNINNKSGNAVRFNSIHSFIHWAAFGKVIKRARVFNAHVTTIIEINVRCEMRDLCVPVEDVWCAVSKRKWFDFIERILSGVFMYGVLFCLVRAQQQFWAVIWV